MAVSNLQVGLAIAGGLSSAASAAGEMALGINGVGAGIGSSTAITTQADTGCCEACSSAIVPPSTVRGSISIEYSPCWSGANSKLACRWAIRSPIWRSLK